MLRTSLRSHIVQFGEQDRRRFLSSNAQDFIEDIELIVVHKQKPQFLSSNAQDFIEDWAMTCTAVIMCHS